MKKYNEREKKRRGKKKKKRGGKREKSIREKIMTKFEKIYKFPHICMASTWGKSIISERRGRGENMIFGKIYTPD